MSKDSTFYFQHDYNVRSDAKIKKIIMKHGMIGYGLFWAIVEDLYNNANALPLDYDCIAYDLRVDEPLVKSILHDFDLFTIVGNTFGSKAIAKRLQDREDKSAKARESAQKRWGKPDSEDANALPPKCDSNAIKERKGDESKEKENKENTSSISDEPSGSEEKPANELSKHQRFLNIFNPLCKREFKTMNDKAQRQLDKLFKKKFTKEDFTKAITNGYADSLTWPKPDLYTPEYITREANFEKYLYMNKQQSNQPNGTSAAPKLGYKAQIEALNQKFG